MNGICPTDYFQPYAEAIALVSPDSALTEMDCTLAVFFLSSCYRFAFQFAGSQALCVGGKRAVFETSASRHAIWVDLPLPIATLNLAKLHYDPPRS